MSTGSAAKFGDSSVKAYPIPSFSRGLNAAVLPYYVRDDHIVEAKNVEITFSGSIRPRLGMGRYDDPASPYYPGVNQYIRNGHRYSKSDGDAEIILNGQVKIFEKLN